MSHFNLLELHAAQAQTLLNKSKNFTYSDCDKQEYQKKLYQLIAKIKESINDKLDDKEIFEKQHHLNFIFQSLEFLKDSTLSSIPFEIVSCLNSAMSDWIDPSKFIIVTSLNNSIFSFSYVQELACNDLLYQSLHANYGIEFDKRLVQINLPHALSRDYLASVVLYHELGHFIDLQYKISESLAYELVYKIGDVPDLKVFLPFTISSHNFLMIKNHIAEYFCDVFASQYIGSSSNNYLKYLTQDSPNFYFTHPSTINRDKMVTYFLNGTDDYLLDLIRVFTSKLTGKALSLKHDQFDGRDFFMLLPLMLNTPENLHGLFPFAWDSWINGKEKFSTSNDLKDKLDNSNIYKIINNLVEKSIGNYFLIKDWEKAKNA